MSTIEKLRGFKDYYPEDQEIRERIFGVMRSTARIYGFLPVDYPSIEYLKLYQIKSGDELVSQTYSFQDKGERDVTLIPEATPSTVRLLLARKEMPRPVKWYNIPKLWRYEEPQSGRNREHSQFNCDFFGEPKWQADVEVISLACRTLDELGLRGLYEVRLNERVLMEKILRSYGSKDIQKSMQIIDRIHKEAESITIENLKVQGISENKIHDLMNFLTSSYSLSSIDNAPIEGIAEYEEMKYLKKLMRRLQDFGFEDVIFNPSTVRGLSYYTGIVFEGFE
jgi:Histidyl-tRNA synthetase